MPRHPLVTSHTLPEVLLNVYSFFSECLPVAFAVKGTSVMPRHFPPAAYTSAALAIIFAALSVWQIVRLADGQQAAHAAWVKARTAAESALTELSTDASLNALPSGNEGERRTIAVLRESLASRSKHIEERLSEAKDEIAATRAVEDRAVQNAEDVRRHADDEYHRRSKTRDDEIEAEKARNKDYVSLWRVTHNPNRTPPWDPGPEVFVHVPWKGKEVDLWDPLEDLVWAGDVTGVTKRMGIGGNYPARRKAWEVGVEFCKKANQHEAMVREARVKLDAATAALEQVKTQGGQVLKNMQARIDVLVANRQRYEEAIKGLAASASVAAVRSGMLYLDVPALLASGIACFLALERLALVTNWFRGRRILRPTSVRPATALGKNR